MIVFWDFDVVPNFVRGLSLTKFVTLVEAHVDLADPGACRPEDSFFIMSPI
jgi:hypothetical protein